MRKILNKGHRIRASDKHLVYHFSIGTLLFVFVAVLLLLNIKQLMRTDWEHFRLLENGLTLSPYNFITILIATGVCALVAFLYYRFCYDSFKKLLHRQKLARMILENNCSTQDGCESSQVTEESKMKYEAYHQVYSYTGYELDKLEEKNGTYYTKSGENILDLVDSAVESSGKVPKEFKHQMKNWIHDLVSTISTRGWNNVPDMTLSILYGKNGLKDMNQLITDVIVWSIEQSGTDTFSATYEVDQQIKEGEQTTAVKATYTVKVHVDADGDMVIVQNPTLAPAIEKSDYEPKTPEADTSVDADTVNDATAFLETFFKLYPTATEKELAYYVSGNVIEPIGRDYLYSELVNSIFTKDGDNVKVKVAVKFLDNQTKATQVSQYELVLHKDSNWKIVG